MVKKSVFRGGKPRPAGEPSRRHGTRARRQGVAAVEMAFILPAFVLLVCGIVEFGHAMMAEQMMTGAAREGARWATLPGATATAVTTKVRTYLAGGSLDKTGVTVTVTPTDLSTAVTGTTVSVRVSAPYTAVSLMPAPWFLKNATLGSQSSMRHE